ncbi:hypothetical protein ACFL2T_07430, partial [Elusimicrobiota bacterium]
FTVRDKRRRVRRRSRERLTLRWTYHYEMRHLLELAGFRSPVCHGDFGGGRPRYGKEQIWVGTR